MAQEPTVDRPVFLSTMAAGRGEWQLALIVVAISAAFFLAAVPFAKMALTPVPAFIPIYQSALVVNDLITAVLLYGQFRILRTRGLLMLAGGYLYTAIMAVVHMLTFPNLFAPTGLLGAGPQSTAWLYMFWHGGFPLFVVAYTLLKDRVRAGAPAPADTSVAIVSSIVAVAVAAIACALVATAGQDLLPAIMLGNRYTPAMIAIVSSVWGLSLLALFCLWRRRPHSVLDLWLMVVMCAWLFDIALAAVLNGGRFDLGFYAGRIYGLLAASFVLLVLLLEYGVLYARLVETHGSERRKGEALAAANKELEAFSYSVSHDLRAPVRAVDGFARILEEDYATRLDDEGRRLLGVVRANSQRMGQLIDDLLAFSRLGRQALKTQPVQLDELMRQTIDEQRADLDGRTVEFAVGTLGVADADPALLKQVLVNLIGNAVKFTRHQSAAVIEIGCRRDDAHGDAPIYYVKDNGAGFDMQYADKLFGVFQRLHRMDEYEGTGVGLAIVQRIINRHGGRVWAESTPGAGAAFYFTLRGTQENPLPKAT